VPHFSIREAYFFQIFRVVVGPGQIFVTWVGSGGVSHLWFGYGFGKFPQKITIFSNFCPSGQKKCHRVGSKSTLVRAGSATYLLRVKSMFGSVHGLSLFQSLDSDPVNYLHPIQPSCAAPHSGLPFSIVYICVVFDWLILRKHFIRIYVMTYQDRLKKWKVRLQHILKGILNIPCAILLCR